MSNPRIRNERVGADTVSVLISEDSRVWDVEIDEHPMSQTVVFEQTTNWHDWTPVNGQRLKGPGPRLGTVYTNAVAGGPAHFRGTVALGVVAFRVRCTRWERDPIDMRITTYHGTHKETLSVRLVGTDGVTFVIQEEMSLEDLLNEL